MLIDCQSCSARPAACDGCFVAFLLDREVASAPELTGEQGEAIANLAASGLIPPLRFAANN